MQPPRLARTGADHERWTFLTWCAGSGIPEVRQLAVTADRWWPEIAAFIDTGHSNARSAGINRVARAAFGFREADNQRLRRRRVTTRRARGHRRTAQLRSPGYQPRGEKGGSHGGGSWSVDPEPACGWEDDAARSAMASGGRTGDAQACLWGVAVEGVLGCECVQRGESVVVVELSGRPG